MNKFQKSNSNQWDEYAPSFSAITTFYQAQLYRAAGVLLAGHVVDFGSGPAKLAPYLADNSNIVSYVGVDSSPEMVALSGEMLNILQDDRFRTVCCPIENFLLTGFTGGVSVNSYYAWKKPQRVLEKIASALNQGADFIIATPNPNLNMERLMKECHKEFILQPAFKPFREWNEFFAKTMRERFVPMDKLVGELRDVDLKIVNCHAHFYEGGVNFVHAQKKR